MAAESAVPRVASDVTEAGDLYLDLLAAAREAALHVIETPPGGLSGAAAYVHRASVELVNATPARRPTGAAAALAAGECLRKLVDVWPRIAAGTLQGERVLAAEPLLWKRLMTDWPMGGFAAMAAGFLIDNRLLGGQVVELGAGVGSASALVAEHVGDGYVRTDLQTFLLTRQTLPGAVARYDFNEPGPWRGVDTIFAINALHCAQDKLRTLGHLREMLRPGGVVVLGEGAPYTDAHGTPWALNGFFGLFRGWWDVSGFLARDQWMALFRAAGFSNAGSAVRHAGEHDLGGLLWAEN